MPALSRPKDGVASLAYVAGIHVLATKQAWMAGTSPAMTVCFEAASKHSSSTKARIGVFAAMLYCFCDQAGPTGGGIVGMNRAQATMLHAYSLWAGA